MNDGQKFFLEIYHSSAGVKFFMSNAQIKNENDEGPRFFGMKVGFSQLHLLFF